MTDEARWYAIYVGDTKRVTIIGTAFRAAQIPHTLWVPKQNVIQKFRGRDRKKLKVFIPGYVFVKFHYIPGTIEDSILNCGSYFLTHPGGHLPVPLEEDFIARVKEFENEKEEVDLVRNTYNLKVGDVVEVLNGPFLCGLGPIKSIKRGLVFVELDLMQRPVEVGLHPRQCLKVSINETKTNNTG